MKKIELTPAIKTKLINARRLGLPYSVVAETAGVSLATLNRWKEDDALQLELDNAKGEGIYNLVNRLYSIATNPDPASLSAQVKALSILLPAVVPEVFKQQKVEHQHLTLKSVYRKSARQN